MISPATEQKERQCPEFCSPRWTGEQEGFRGLPNALETRVEYAAPHTFEASRELFVDFHLFFFAFPNARVSPAGVRRRTKSDCASSWRGAGGAPGAHRRALRGGGARVADPPPERQRAGAIVRSTSWRYLAK